MKVEIEKLKDLGRRIELIIGPKSAAICCLTVSISALWSLQMYGDLDFTAFLANASPKNYEPIGILAFWGKSPPSAEFLAAIRSLGLGATIAAIFGISWRLCNGISLFCGLMIYGFVESFVPYWSHGYNALFLAQLPLLFLKPDPRYMPITLARRLFSFTKRDAPSTALSPHVQVVRHWPLLVSQILVACMFASATFFKLRAGDYTLAWALSDNLRGLITLRYLGLGHELPSHLNFIVNNAWVYKSLAFGNLIAQALPLLAGLFLFSPWMRLLGGLCYFMEFIGLGVIMGLWNMHLAVLVVLFVNWDFFLLRIKAFLPPFKQSQSSNEYMSLESSVSLDRSAALAFCAVCVFMQCLTGFSSATRFSYELNAYPFSPFNMYSSITAKKPYDQHSDLTILGANIELDCPTRNDLVISAENKMKHALRSEVLFHAKSQKTREQIISKAWSAGLGACGKELREVRVYKTTYRIPAYPAKIKLIIASQVLVGKKSGALIEQN